MKILGITGPAAAGKGEVVKYLVEKKGFAHFSASNFLKDILLNENKEVNRDSMRNLADQLREKYGPSYVIEQLYLQAQKKNNNSIIESIRTVGEIELLRKCNDFLLISIDADQKLRYQRAVGRNSEKDHISREKFQEQELLESNNSNPNKGNILACQKLADIKIENNGTEKELYEQLDRLLNSVL